ncbi:MFS transporter [Paenibacillus sinopodophylli]|uniref:MFS transporter n=1 Tax=Paenibacillus sinopodophylli TaxID=1837342 RepID=UPI00110CEEA6|nr:MFS transporter [Paenibacillus sinopodophylli]
MSTINRQVITPFKRLVAANMVGQAFILSVNVIAPTLIIPFKLKELDPVHYGELFGYISGIIGLIALLFGPFCGYISDRTVSRFGRRRLWILLGGLVGALSIIPTAYATNAIQVAVFWGLSVAALSFNFALNPVLAADQIDESRLGTYGGITGFGGLIFSTAALALMSTLMGASALTLKTTILGVAACVGIIIQVLMIKEGKVEYVYSAKIKGSFIERITAVYPSPRKYPAFTWGLFTRLLIGFAFATSAYNTVMMLQKFKFSDETVQGYVGLIGVITVVTISITTVLGGTLSDKLRKQKPFVYFSGVFMAAALVIQAFTHSFPLVLVSFGMIGIAYGVFLSVDTALMIRLLPNKNNAGKDLGIIGIPTNLANPVVLFIAPFLVATTGWTGFYLVFGAVAFISIFTLFSIPEMSPKQK